ncbi:MAG: UDP-N-acetylmuramoyl-L-alanyl-D-glutamate--2,6-diaminopimelate ligase [Calditrichaeota bacterium]|nr:UDP-N-acetylmuramoyl-L-alanyl-D-glutamate--2,6-diaminopimelate ligase [Calditrichota bacterium]
MAKRLFELLRELPAYELHGTPNLEIENLIHDSRQAATSSLFVAIAGFRQDGRQFVSEALSRGAVAIVSERRLPNLEQVTQIIVPNAREALAYLSWAFAEHPERRLQLCGVTGTNGKTTITHLLRAMLESAGKKTGLVGTLTYEFDDEVVPATRTTPEATDLAALFRSMSKRGATHCVMEVTSHSLALHRVKGLSFRVATFSNLSRDHLDLHGTLEEYANAKALLFENLEPEATAVINIDDRFGVELCKRTKARVLRCSLRREAEVHATRVVSSSDGIEMDLNLPKQTWHLRSRLIGGFNASNVLLAAGCAYALGLSESEVQQGLEKVRNIPGRMELIRAGQPFGAIVDYAHTPDALMNVLDTLRALNFSRILVLFGAGGDRDRGKRREMGRIASERADEVFLTSDNPRSEDPEAIIDEIEAGLLPGIPHYRNADRRAAIEWLLKSARDSDVVLIAGKGAETTQEIRGKKYPFDDREVAKEILGKMGFQA